MSTAHVVPLRDLIDHHVPGVDLGAVTDPRPWFVTLADDGDPACACGPTVELMANAGPDAWMYVHASLDGRELRETA